MLLKSSSFESALSHRMPPLSMPEEVCMTDSKFCSSLSPLVPWAGLLGMFWQTASRTGHRSGVIVTVLWKLKSSDNILESGAILLHRNDHLVPEKILFMSKGQKCIICHTIKTMSSDSPVSQSTV